MCFWKTSQPCRESLSSQQQQLFPAIRAAALASDSAFAFAFAAAFASAAQQPFVAAFDATRAAAN